MKHRLVVIDLDDTLIGSDLRISKPNRRAIALTQKRGVMVTLATGRTFATTRDFLKELRITLPVLCYQGALIRSLRKVYYRQLLPHRHLREVIEYGFRHRVQIAVYTKGTVYLHKPLNHWGKEYLNRIEQVREISLVDLRRYSFLARWPIKVMYIAHEEKAARLEKLARVRFGKHFSIMRSRLNLIEFLHPDVSKGKSVERLAHILGVHMHETIAIGDGYNDISMLRRVGLGIAVKNAPMPVERAADWVVPSQKENGVAVALERFILKKS